ncbi:MAG: T9SS type A sorting domain-containing protein [Saprospiraceae bacterium]|nr:T9SS type A sorting domain-containing protein [Saprospiraceae bacterium]
MRKKTTLPILAFCFIHTALLGQLPTGSIAPDFNVMDINGNQHHLYSYLNQGKTVILDFSAAWCPLCWNYHNSKALSDFYTLYGPSGSDQAMVLFIERDQQMGIEDLRGNTNASAGDWITGTPYPIIDTSVMNADYQPVALPQIYGVHPDRRVTQLRTPSTETLLSFVQSFEPVDSMPMEVMIEYNVREVRDVTCAGDVNGSIDIDVSGPGMTFTYDWSNGSSSQDISALSGGIYSCVITDNLGNELTTEPIEILEPDSLIIDFLTNTPSTMTATDGSLIADVSGGTPPYSYVWSTGRNGATLSSIGEGTYSVQVTDANGCTGEGMETVDVPDCTLFLAINVEPSTCDENADGEVNLLVERAQGGVTFAWNTGDSTQNISGLQSGGYEVTVTDGIGCSATAAGMVGISDPIPPVARVRTEFYTLYLNESGSASLSAAQVDSGSFDNCSILGRQLSQEVFDCGDIGRNFVQFAVIDEALNMTRREIEVTILDTIKPYFTCPDTTLTYRPCNGVVNYPTPTIRDNCPQGSSTGIVGQASGTVFQPGLHTVTYNYVSFDGNRANCSINLNIEEWIEADLVVNDADCAGENSGSATVVLNNANGEYAYQWSDGQTTGAAIGLEAGDYRVVVEDTTECRFEFDFFVGEPVATFARVDSILAPDGRGDVYISVFGGTAPYRFEWILNGNVVSTVRNPQNLQFGLYTLRITDQNDCVEDFVGIRVDNTTSVTESVTFKGTQVSPNPNQGTFTVRLPAAATGVVGSVKMVNLLGQVVWSQDVIFSTLQEIQTQLTPGTYFLTLEDSKGMAVRKVIVR